jgi:hypothetical protein
MSRVARARRRSVFLSRDFTDLASPQSISRALRLLVAEGYLIKLGQGVYAKAEMNRLTGEPMIACNGGFGLAARQALTRLGVKWEPCQAEKDFNEGRSDQVPVTPAVKVRSRCSRRLAYGNRTLAYE